MKPSVFAILIALLSPLLLSAKDKEEVYNVEGRIINHHGNPMSAVIVEIANTDIYTLSDIDGNFCLEIIGHNLPATISFRFVDYFTRHINVTPQMAADSILVTLLPGNDKDAERLSAKHKHKYGSFGLSASCTYLNADFTGFSELNDALKEQLNNNSHFIGFGIEADVMNIYAQVNFGFAPMRKSLTSQYRLLTDAYSISFNVGYTFPFFKRKVLLITPFLGINHLSYNEYIAPLKPHIDLDEFLSMGYVDYSALQYTGNLGAKIAVKLADFGRYKQQGIYLNVAAAYHFKINRNPYIYSRATHIHTSSSIKIYPLAVQASIIYKIGPKIK